MSAGRYAVSLVVASLLLSVPLAALPGGAGKLPPGLSVEDGCLALTPERFIRAFYDDVERSLRGAGHDAFEVRVDRFIHVGEGELAERRIGELLTDPVGWHLVITPGSRTTTVDGVVVERRRAFELQWRYREPWWPAEKDEFYRQLPHRSVAEFAALAVARGEEDWAIDRLVSYRVRLRDESGSRVYRAVLTIVDGDEPGDLSFQVRDPVLDNTSSAVPWMPLVHELLRERGGATPTK